MLIQLSVSWPVTAVSRTTATARAPEAGSGIAEDTVAPKIDSAPTDQSKTPGVLRHLQAGKFKGVADVRLRIVFQKQLAELAEQQAIARVTDGSGELVSSLATEIRGFAASTTPADAETAVTEPVAVDTEVTAPINVETAISEFQIAVSAATNSLAEGEGLKLPDYAATLQAAFDSLVSQLEIALNPDTDGLQARLQVTVQNHEAEALDVTVTATVSGESDTNPMNDSDFLAGLREMFSQELTVLMESAESRDILPPLSEPQDNGRAYDKFKAIYDELSAPDAGSEDNTNINVEA